MENPDNDKPGIGGKSFKVTLHRDWFPHAGVQIKDPTRVMQTGVVKGPAYVDYYKRDTTKAWSIWKRKNQRKTMQFLPIMVQLLTIVVGIPGFLALGLVFDAAYFTAMGWFFTLVFSQVAKLWLKDRYL